MSALEHLSGILKKRIWILFLLFLVFDICYSSYHYSNLPLDGDLPRVAGPFKWYEKVLEDPIGLDALRHQEKYPAAGRYVSHRFTIWWFSRVNQAVRIFITNPVKAIYATSNLLVALVHILFVLLMYLYTKEKDAFSMSKFTTIALLSSVFIQYGSYYDCIGFIDRSILFVIFYALPITILGFYFLPFWQASIQNDSKIPLWKHGFMFLAAPILSFSGPLIQPVVLIITALYFTGVFIKNPFFNIQKNKALVLQLLFFALCCLYAFIVSRYNSESGIDKPLAEKYFLMAKGLYRIFQLTYAWPILLSLLIFNTIVVNQLSMINHKKMRTVYFFILGFCALYVLLLPLGGYRVYREYIIRYDTFIPVSLGVFFLILYTSYHLINHLKGKSYLGYLSLYILMIFFFFKADIQLEKEANYCQQGALYEIAKSKEAVIKVPFNCNVLTWSENDIHDQEHMLGINRCLTKWGFIQDAQRVEFYVPKSDN